MSAVMKHTMVVRHPDTMEATPVLAGDPRPDWAKDLIHDDNLEDAKGSDSGSNYTGTKDELQAEADKRGLEVEGTGKDGAVVKADLVKALEADDAENAENA